MFQKHDPKFLFEGLAHPIVPTVPGKMFGTTLASVAHVSLLRAAQASPLVGALSIVRLQISIVTCSTSGFSPLVDRFSGPEYPRTGRCRSGHSMVVRDLLIAHDRRFPAAVIGGTQIFRKVGDRRVEDFSLLDLLPQ